MGKTLFVTDTITRFGETPPRTWGRLTRAEQKAFNRRNTPTHVGKTLDAKDAPAEGWKHPHARGEDYRGNSINSN